MRERERERERGRERQRELKCSTLLAGLTPTNESEVDGITGIRERRG